MKKTIVVASLTSLVLSASAKIEMGTPFSDGMVLQRGMKVPVWGKAEPGRKVTVEFAGNAVSAVACPGGCWKVSLPPMEASKESRVLTVTEGEAGFLTDSTCDAVEIKDVLVGEVWFASGQSNMECPIWGANTRYRDGKGGLMTTMTQLPYVRFAKNSRVWAAEPGRAQSKGWKRYVPESLRPGGLSAVAFYYARELYLALDVPVGIVDSSWGGTNIDAWTPRCGYEGCDSSVQATADYKVKKEWNAKTDKKGSTLR